MVDEVAVGNECLLLLDVVVAVKFVGAMCLIRCWL